MEAAKGTDLYDRYKCVERKIGSTSNKLRRKRLDQAIQDFHDSVDTIEVNKQLYRITVTGILT